MKRFKVLLIIVIVLIGIIIAFFGPIILKAPGRKDVFKEKKALQHPIVAAKGIVESRDKVEISSKVLGLIHDISVVEGENITKGQKLVILQNKESREQIIEAEALTKKPTQIMKKQK